MEDKDKDFGLMKVELSNYCVPTFDYSNNKDWVKFGANNNYPDYLIDLFNRNAVHGAIVKGKVSYVYGKGLVYEGGSTVLDKARVELWLENANRYETWNEVYERICSNFEMFNGFALQLIYDYKGKIAETYCMEFAKLRRSKDGKKVMYCDAWEKNGQTNQNPENDSSYVVYDIFNPNIRTGTQVLYFKVDGPTTQKYGHLYPIPEYGQATADIETDIEITNFHFHNLKNGMFASALLSLFNGEPTPEQKRAIKKMFTYTHTGSVNAGKLIFSFNDKGGTAPTLQILTPSDLDKQFEQLGKRLQQNIFTAHRADPLLFGVMTEGSLADTGGEAIIKKWDKFVRTYVEQRQNIILNQIRIVGEINGLDLNELDVKQTSPVGRELPSDPNILNLFEKADLQKYFAKMYDIEITNPLESVVSGGVQAEGMVNEHIKALTGKQWINIKRLVRELTNGKITKEVAKMMLQSGYGLNDSDIETLLKTPETQFKAFAKVTDDAIIEMFEAAAIDECVEDEFISEDFVYTQMDATKKELKFANQYDDPKKLDKAIIDITTGNPYIKEEDIARQLQLPLTVIVAAIGGLVLSGLLDTSAGLFNPTQKALDLEVPTVETEIYTVYKYVTRPDVPEVETTSRFFCKKMLALTRNGKVWTREALDELTNTTGEDAWIYRGGFYTNPNTKETTPYCRHIWKSIVKSRKVKK